MFVFQEETHGGTADTAITDDILDDFFGTTPSQPAANGVADRSSDSALKLNDIDGIEEGDENSKSKLAKESSPEIIVDCLDSVENVTLKDATSEKTLLGNGGESEGTALCTDSLGSKTEEVSVCFCE